MAGKQKDYFSSREAAELLGVAVSTVQTWTNNGQLRAWVTGGGHRRIARNSVELMLRQQQVAAGESELKKLSVVVVEDNAQQLRMYEQQFQAWKMDVRLVTAKDGFEGSIKIGQTLPDVIIADLQMPKLDGFQMIRALKDLSDLQHSLIIVVTGLSENEIKARGGLPDGVHLFIKPVPFENIESLIRQQIKLKTTSISTGTVMEGNI